MTAFTTGTIPATPGADDQLLRFALRADATLCAGLGLFIAMAADALAPLTGLTATVGWFLGAALVGYGALLYTVTRVRAVRRVGHAVLVGNVVFAAAVALVLGAGWLPLTGFGVAAAAAFIVLTLGFAGLQYLGVRRLA